MSNIHESGPAYPIVTGSEVYGLGMSLRDWFAGQALVSIGTWTPLPQVENLWSEAAMSARANFAYRQADAMLAARGQP